MVETTITQGMWCHVEIPSKDPAASAKFYGEVFGWKFSEMPMGGDTYHLYETAEGGIGGGIHNPPEGMPRQMINYVAVDEIEPIVASVESNGGSVVVPKQEVHGIGWFSLISDPDGNVFGLWQSNPNACH